MSVTGQPVYCNRTAWKLTEFTGLKAPWWSSAFDNCWLASVHMSHATSSHRQQ